MGKEVKSNSTLRQKQQTLQSLFCSSSSFQVQKLQEIPKLGDWEYGQKEPGDENARYVMFEISGVFVPFEKGAGGL